MNMTGTANPAAPDPLAQDFVQFAVEAGVLRFGEFKTKAGRLSPYFFNAGGFDDGAKLGRLAEFYARRLVDSGLQFDMLFGPAYKGITLAAAVAIELAEETIDLLMSNDIPEDVWMGVKDFMRYGKLNARMEG